MKTLIVILLLMPVIMLQAQDTKSVYQKLEAGKLEEAKKEIDELAANPKTASNSDTWFCKVKVYRALYDNEELYKKYGKAIYSDRLAAFKKYVDLEIKNNNKANQFAQLKEDSDLSTDLASMLDDIHSQIEAGPAPRNWDTYKQYIDIAFAIFPYQSSFWNPEKVKYYTEIGDLKGVENTFESDIKANPESWHLYQDYSDALLKFAYPPSGSPIKNKDEVVKKAVAVLDPVIRLPFDTKSEMYDDLSKAHWAKAEILFRSGSGISLNDFESQNEEVKIVNKESLDNAIKEAELIFPIAEKKYKEDSDDSSYKTFVHDCAYLLVCAYQLKHNDAKEKFYRDKADAYY